MLLLAGLAVGLTDYTHTQNASDTMFSLATTVHARFSDWKAAHNKIYDSGATEASAFSAFARAEHTISAHNAKDLSYTLAHNEFSDLTWEEFRAQRLGYARNVSALREPSASAELAAATVSVDWEQQGKVTGVKNQAQCGSCWAFASVGAIESAFSISSGQPPPSLSEEQLLQCDYRDKHCMGGDPANAMVWTEENPLCGEADWPYTSGDGHVDPCPATRPCTPLVQVGGAKRLSPTEAALGAALQSQPVAVGVRPERMRTRISRPRPPSLLTR